MLRRRDLLCFAILATATVAAPARGTADAWDAAVRSDAAGRQVRFIPPELYAGAPWSGERAVALRPMRVTTRPQVPADHPAITISYPAALPGAPGVLALRRVRHGRRSGTVEQYFVVNERGDGLGRLADFRPGRARPEMAECFKFPLGEWRQGEMRTCRESTIRIIEIDFTYAGAPHALMFRWNDEGTYVFAPGRGLMAVMH